MFQEMVHKVATIQNNMGIHVRPTGVIIDTMNDVKAQIKVCSKGLESNLKDHISILAMGLCKGDSVDIYVSGDKEEDIANTLVELFQREFDFPPRSSMEW